MRAAHPGVDVHDRAARVVEHPELAEPPAAPYPVGDREIDEGEPQTAEPEHRGEPQPLRHPAEDEGEGDDREGELEHREDALRDGAAQGAALHAGEERLAEAAREPAAVPECEAVAVCRPEDGGERGGAETLHHDGEDVPRSHQPPVEERHAGQGHEQHEGGRGQHPGGVAGVERIRPRRERREREAPRRPPRRRLSRPADHSPCACDPPWQSGDAGGLPRGQEPFVRRYRVDGERMDRAHQLGRERLVDEAVPAEQPLALEPPRGDDELEVRLGPGRHAMHVALVGDLEVHGDRRRRAACCGFRLPRSFRHSPAPTPGGPNRPRRSGAVARFRFRVRLQVRVRVRVLPFSHFHANTGCSKCATRVARFMSSHSRAW